MSPVVTWLLWNTFLALALAFAACFVQRRLHQPAFAHLLWLLALVRLVAPPFLDGPEIFTASAAPARTSPPTEIVPGIPLPLEGAFEERSFLASELLPERPAVPVNGEGVAQENEPPASSTPIPWLALWGGLVALLFVRRFRDIARFESLLRLGEGATPSLTARTRRLANTLGLRRTPELVVLKAPVSPMLFGTLRRARIVLPHALLGALNARQRDALLLHELAHWKRRDHWVRHLELLVTTAFFWHPLAHWIRKGLRECEEQCCDAWVTALLPRERKSYANTLVDTLSFLSGKSTALPALASGATSLPLMQRRLHMILHRTVRPTTGRRTRVLLGAFALAAIPIGPSLGQARRAPAPVQEPETIIETVLEKGQVLRVRHGDVDVEIRPTGDGNVKVVATRRKTEDPPGLSYLTRPAPSARSGSRAEPAPRAAGPRMGGGTAGPRGPSRVSPGGPAPSGPATRPGEARTPGSSRGLVPGPSTGTVRSGGGTGGMRSRSNPSAGAIERIRSGEVAPRSRGTGVGGFLPEGETRWRGSAPRTDALPPILSPNSRTRDSQQNPRSESGHRGIQLRPRTGGIEVAPRSVGGGFGGRGILRGEAAEPPIDPATRPPRTESLPPIRSKNGEIMVEAERPASIAELVAAIRESL